MSFADFTATYYTTNLMYYIDNSYENRIPAIGHISAGNSGHAVTICGYYTKIVTYTETGILGTVTRNIEYNFVGIILDGFL